MISCLASEGVHIYAGTFANGMFVSADDGSTWTAANNGLTNQDIRSLTTDGTNIYVGTSGGGIFLTSDHGATWVPAGPGLPNYQITALEYFSGYLFAGIYGNGVYISSDMGATWFPFSDGLTGKFIDDFAFDGTTVYVGVAYNSIWSRPFIQTGFNHLHSVNEDIEIFPNPVDKNKFLTIKAGIPVTGIDIISLNGASVKHMNPGISLPSSILVDIGGLPKGFYMIRLMTSEGVINKKLVID
jgi:hypothetical protein